MSIEINEKEQLFALHTPETSYVVGIADGLYAGHVYYGKRLRHASGAYLMRTGQHPFTPSALKREKGTFMSVFPFAYPTQGVGDYRTPALQVRNSRGMRGCELHYTGYRIDAGKPALEGLPATFAKEGEASTLTLFLADEVIGLEAELRFTCFEDLDAITRSVVLKNTSWEPLYLEKVLSFSMETDNAEHFELLSLSGTWARERNIIRSRLDRGIYSVGSVRGESSQQENPFTALVSPDCCEDRGIALGVHFVYSGNFIAEAEITENDMVRLNMGIHPGGFSWKLEPGASFTAPEVVSVYSCEGLGKMSRTFHDLYREHLIRSPWLKRERPILINNWEATYFNFNTEKLISIAREAKKCGIEMLVMDDGWFGRRDSDASSLGDWFVNEEKLPGGLKVLADRVNEIGLKFGIWMEPEMVSPDSELYRAHPDWAIRQPGRDPVQFREQYVLDITRREVRDYVYEQVSSILKSANIAYVKWDMNRYLADMGSLGLDADRQGEQMHRYTLAVYELQERMLAEFPDLLLENCSSGGARFDPGMLYYSPQIWCSDDMDVAERLFIQEGTALCYPLSCIGAHVGASPNHTTGRVAPFITRGHAALSGTFGYELDVTKLPEEEKALIPGQCADYHRFHHLAADGDYYRVASYRENREYDAWMSVSKDKREALVTFIQVLNRPNFRSYRIFLKGLDPEAVYRLEESGSDGGSLKLSGDRIPGDVLMYGGLLIPRLPGDLKSRLIYLVKE